MIFIGIIIGFFITLLIICLYFYLFDFDYSMTFSELNTFVRAYEGNYIKKTLKSKILYKKITNDPLYNLWKYMHDNE